MATILLWMGLLLSMDVCEGVFVCRSVLTGTITVCEGVFVCRSVLTGTITVCEGVFVCRSVLAGQLLGEGSGAV
jgi:hypothetical protein